MSIGPWQILIIALIVFLLFGSKRLARLGSELGTGARMLKKGLRDINAEEGTSQGVARSAGATRGKRSKRSKPSDVAGSVAEVAKVARKVNQLRRFPFR